MMTTYVGRPGLCYIPPMIRVLVIEDDQDVASLLERGFREEGYTVACAFSAAEAFRKLPEGWDLAVLDLMLPDAPGEAVLRYMEQRPDRPPVLVLTARDEIATKLQMFDRGCDDYVTKPFAFEELLRRARALLRRSVRVNLAGPSYEDMRLCEETHSLSVGDNSKISLTPKEFLICRRLLSEPGRVVSRKELLHAVWGYVQEPNTNFIEVHLANLRKKLRSLGRDEWVRTVRSSGVILARPQSDGP